MGCGASGIWGEVREYLAPRFPRAYAWGKQAILPIREQAKWRCSRRHRDGILDADEPFIGLFLSSFGEMNVSPIRSAGTGSCLTGPGISCNGDQDDSESQVNFRREVMAKCSQQH
jgi:hypothetical protein